MSVVATAIETLPRPRRRTETEAVAEAAMALLAAGVLSVGVGGPTGPRAARAGRPVSDATLSRVSGIVGVAVPALRDAWETNQRHGYRPPGPDRRRAPVPDIQGQRPANRGRFAAKNPAPGKRICSDCEQEKDVEEFNVKNPKTGNRMSWCQPCGKARSRRNYVSAAEAGIVTLARAYLAASSPFIGQACPDCGTGLEAGQEVEGCQVALRHVACPTAPAKPVARPPRTSSRIVATADRPRLTPPAPPPVPSAFLLPTSASPDNDPAGPVGRDAAGRAGNRAAGSPSAAAASLAALVPSGLPARDPKEDRQVWEDRLRRASAC